MVIKKSSKWTSFALGAVKVMASVSVWLSSQLLTLNIMKFNFYKTAAYSARLSADKNIVQQRGLMVTVIVMF